MSTTDIRELAWSSLEAVLGARMPTVRSDDLVLVGEGLLSSLELVTVLIELEERLASAGTTVLLADAKAMSRQRSPFRTVGTLIEYVQERCA